MFKLLHISNIILTFAKSKRNNNQLKLKNIMKVYIVSYTSFYGEICNEVLAFVNKQDAIESANNYVECDINEEVDVFCKTTKNFNSYTSGYKEINVTDHFNDRDFQVSITETTI